MAVIGTRGASQASEKEKSSGNNADAPQDTQKPRDSPQGDTPGDTSSSTPKGGTWKSAKPTKAGNTPNDSGSNVSKNQQNSEASPANMKPDEIRSILSARPFIISAFLSKPGTDGVVATEATESLLSRTLDSGVLAKGGRAINLTLATVRKLLKSMSSFSGIHKFCTASGVLVSDETISLLEYLSIEPPIASSSKETGTPTLNVYYRSPSSNPMTSGASAPLGSPDAPQADTALSQPDTSNFKSAELTATQPTIEDDVVTIGAQSGRERPLIGAGTLTEVQWSMVLRNCAVLYGWIVDPSTKQIKQAPKAAFQIRSSIHNDPVSKIPAFSSSRNDHSENARAKKRSRKTSKKASTTKPDSDPSKQAPSQTPSPNQETQMVPPAAQADATSIPTDDQTSQDGQDQATPSNSEGDGSSVPVDGSDDQDGQDDQDQSSPPATGNDEASSPEDDDEDEVGGPAVDLSRLIKEKSDKGIPNFRVNDDSKIEVTVTSSELSTSMVQNDFSSQSTSASVGGGAFGIQASVSAGYSNSDSTGMTATSDTSQWLMIAKYLYPRCDLLLYPDDLEPSPEFAALVKKIHKKKDIRALRQLQAEFGQLFCQQVTLGGRLMTSRAYQDKTTDTDTQKTEAYKWSVGVAVTTPYVSASASHSQENTSSTDNDVKSANSSERHAFEAVGGDTILVNNPSAWAATVARPETWRVINRDLLVPLVDMVSQMPGYEAVQSWFVQAVPALSRYIALGQSRRVMARFKVVTPAHNLCLDNPGDGSVVHYLSNITDHNSRPLRLPLDTSTQASFWSRAAASSSSPNSTIFQPQTFRAPVLNGFKHFGVDKTLEYNYGTDYNNEFASTNWNIVAPFTDVLKHGCRVVLLSAPKRVKIADSQPDTNPPNAHMVVFRNAQGVFLPGLSDLDEYQYWRILKVGAINPGEPIMPGDTVRLCWAFKDQTTGFRDFTDDAFGRRQMRPSIEKDTGVLYLKVPWPRFEGLGTPTTMIMSSQPSSMPSPTLVNVMIDGQAGVKPYTPEDIQFRLDVLDQETGDANDYLLHGVQQIDSVPAPPIAGLSSASVAVENIATNIWALLRTLGI